MNDLNQHHQQLLRETVQKLCEAMDKIKLSRAMSEEDAEKIRKEVDDVKGTLFSIGDINPNIKHLELFKQGADLVEELLNTLTRPYEHLV